eukprot:255242_1
MTNLVILGLMTFNVVLFGLIFTPILTYHSYKYYLFREHIAMQKRYCHINMFEIAATISKLLLAVTTTLLLIFNIGFESVIFNTFELLQQLSVFCTGYVQIWRFWMLRYDIIFTNIAINDEWKSIINPFYTNSKSGTEHQKLSWYFQHRTNFGDAKWFGTRIILPLIILSAAIHTYILLTDTLHHETYGRIQTDQLIASIVNVTPLIAFIILYAKTPYIDDNFFIRSEMKLLFIYKALDFIAYFVFLVYHYIYEHVMGYDPSLLPFRILEMVQFDFIVSCQFAIGIVSTYWVNKKLQPIIVNHQYTESSKTSISRCVSFPGSDVEMHEMGGSNLRKSSLFSASSEHNIYPLFRIKAPKTPPQNGLTPFMSSTKTDSGTSSPTDIGLMHILQHPKGFELFIHHLLFEFSSECALSLIEMVQFQQYIYQWLETHDALKNEDEKVKKMHDESLYRKVNLPSNIPLSFWIYGQTTSGMDEMKFEEIEYKQMCGDTKIIAYHLAQRYVFEGAEYEINIPYTLRSHIVKQMETYEVWIGNEQITLHHLIALYEECVNSMYSLMRGSYERFKRTKQYWKLQSLWMI